MGVTSVGSRRHAFRNGLSRSGSGGVVGTAGLAMGADSTGTGLASLSGRHLTTCETATEGTVGRFPCRRGPGGYDCFRKHPAVLGVAPPGGGRRMGIVRNFPQLPFSPRL